MDGPPLPLTVGAASSARAGHSGPLRGVQTSCDPSYSSQAGWGWQLWPLERLPAGCRPMRREAWQAPNGLAADAATRALAAWGSSLRGSFSVACPSSTDSSDGGHVVGIAQHPCRMQGKRMPSAHAGAPASTVLSEKTGRKGPRGPLLMGSVRPPWSHLRSLSALPPGPELLPLTRLPVIPQLPSKRRVYGCTHR